MMTVSRAEFEQAIQDWLTHGSYGVKGNSSRLRSINPADWTLQHSLLTKHAYLERRGKLVSHRHRSSDDDSGHMLQLGVINASVNAEVQDEAAIALPPHSSKGSAFADLSIVYSPSYQTPCLYFRVYSPDGAPHRLADALQTSLFHQHGVEQVQDSTCEAEGEPSFPALSQAEHPATGNPCLMLHPCETARTLIEILDTSDGEISTPLMLLRAWLMLVSTFIDIS